MSDARVASASKRKRAPWRGRMRVRDARKKIIPVRCNDQEHVAIKAVADDAGLSVGAFLRALALGDAGPRAVRKPPVERQELVRLLGAIGKLGSNINQITKQMHLTNNLPSWSELAVMREDIGKMRDALMKALGRDH